MFGTVITFRPLAGKEQAFRDLFWEQSAAHGGSVPGFVAQYLLEPVQGAGDWQCLVIFESEESYRENARSPEQHAVFLNFRALAVGDPSWNDGNVIQVEASSVAI